MSESDPAAQPQTERRQSADSDRRSVVDRRSGIDRRDQTGLRRLRGPGRRRPEFNRSAEEGEFTSEQFLFVMAIDAFKRANQKTFPTWTEVLEVIRKLGYRKTCASELNLPNAEDWLEDPNSPAMPASKTEPTAEQPEETVDDDVLADALFDDDD